MAPPPSGPTPPLWAPGPPGGSWGTTAPTRWARQAGLKNQVSGRLNRLGRPLRKGLLSSSTLGSTSAFALSFAPLPFHKWQCPCLPPPASTGPRLLVPHPLAAEHMELLGLPKEGRAGGGARGNSHPGGHGGLGHRQGCAAHARQRDRWAGLGKGMGLGFELTLLQLPLLQLPVLQLGCCALGMGEAPGL
jgi:hypothetical protein